MADRTGWWGRRSGPAKAGVAVIVLLVVALVAGGIWLGGSPEINQTEEPVAADARATQTLVTSTLRSAEVNASLVDVTEERVYVAYSLPTYAYDETGAVDEPVAIELQRFAVGAAADAAPWVDRIVVVQYDGDSPVLLWEVPMTAFDSYVAGELSLGEFEDRIRAERYG